MKEGSKAGRRTMFSSLLQSDGSFVPRSKTEVVADEASSSVSGENSPYEIMSPWNQMASPYARSPWTNHYFFAAGTSSVPTTELIGSLVREEGHVYSLATTGDLLYTGSESKNIRVWRDQEEFSGFKSSSGFVKAIVIAGDRRVFTGHQDGKIRVWRVSSKNPKVHKRAGTLPKLKDYVKSSLNPNNYVEVRRHRNVPWIRHFDAISCLSLSEDQDILYSGSWDRTIKVWRVSDSKCLESINAHHDAVNSVVAGFGVFMFSGSADGTMKVWRREMVGKATSKHLSVETLLDQDSAVTALATNPTTFILYCGTSDGLVNFWEMRKDCLSHGGVLRSHKLAVLCLATAGSLVLSGSTDKSICVWRRNVGDVQQHSCMAVLRGHLGPVKCLAVEEDSEPTAEGRRWMVYSGSLDRSVKVWKVPELAHGQTVQTAAIVVGHETIY